MKFLTLAGNGRIKEQLSQRRELSHAYLISGPAGSGRHTAPSGGGHGVRGGGRGPLWPVYPL